MTQLLKVVITALMIAGVTGCVDTKDIKVEAMKSEKVNLAGYKTYDIIEGSGLIKGTKVNDTTLNAQMQQMINVELAKKGKLLVTEDPDFYVAYLAGKDMNAVKEKLDAAGKKTLDKTPEAAIVLVLIDADTGVIIGISTAEGKVKGLDTEDRNKRLHYAIKEMLSTL